jgi:hypothetical protein
VKIQLLSQSTAAISTAKSKACRQGVSGCQRLKIQPAKHGKQRHDAAEQEGRNGPASHHGMPPKTDRLT